MGSMPEPEDNELRSMIGSGRKIAVIAYVRQKHGCSLAQAKKIVEDMAGP